jgi:hypothetical protein
MPGALLKGGEEKEFSTPIIGLFVWPDQGYPTHLRVGDSA